MPSDPVICLCDGPMRLLVDEMDRIKSEGGYTIKEGALMDSIRGLCIELIEACRN